MAELIPIANLRGPQGNKGEKGDPGGWVIGNNLGAITNNTALNLNDVRTPGLYWQGSTSTITSGLYNYPPVFDINGSARGHLRVTSWGGGQNAVQQEYVTIGTGFGGSGAQRPPETWIRTYGSDAWSEWSVRVSQRIDNTAGRAVYTWDHTAGREQLVYGDTGWCRLTSSTLSSKIWDTTTLNLRRVNNTVEFLLIGVNPVGLTAPIDLQGFLAIGQSDIPLGFRPSSNTYHMGFGRFSQSSGSSTPRQYVIGVMRSTGGLHFEKDETAPNGIFLSSTSSIYISGTYTTTSSWPTTLPGVPG